MNIIEKERHDIEDKIAQIKRDKEEAGLDVPVEIAAGVPVLKGQAKEYKILVRLLAILDNNMMQDGINEYLDKRSQVDLPPLPEEEKNVFQNPMTQRFAERDLIKDAMEKIASKTPKSGYTRASDGNYVDPLDLPNYENLYTMKTITNRNFKTDDYYTYYDLRAESSLGPISEGKLQALMGRAPLPSEKRTEAELQKVIEDGQKKIDERNQSLGLDNTPKAEDIPAPNDIPPVVEESERVVIPPAVDPLGYLHEEKQAHNYETQIPAEEPERVVTSIAEDPLSYSHLETHAHNFERFAPHAAPQSATAGGSQPFKLEIEELGGPANSMGTQGSSDDQIEDITKKEEEVQEQQAPVSASQTGTVPTPGEKPDDSKKDKEEIQEQAHIEPSMPLSNGTSAGPADAGIPEQPSPTLSDEEKAIAEELQAIQARKNALKSLYQLDSSALNPRTTSDGSLVKDDDDYEEYETLSKLENYAKEEFKDITIEDYRRLRETTKVDPIASEKYDKLFEKKKKAEVDNGSGTGDAGQSGNPDQQPEEEKLYEVVKTSLWTKIKDHKKEILIALGIAAISISLIVLVTQLLPAYVAASNASTIAGLAQEMVNNSALHLTSNAAEKVALHAANRSLANGISALSGLANNFNTSTYLWTFGGQPIADFVASSVTTAAAATAKVSSLTNLSLISGLGGLGTLGLGLVTRKKSKEFKEIKEEIYALLDTAEERTVEEQIAEAQKITNKIIASEKLTENEKMVLFKRLQKAIARARKYGKKVASTDGEAISENAIPPLTDNHGEEPEEEIEKVEAEIVDPQDVPGMRK